MRRLAVMLLPVVLWLVVPTAAHAQSPRLTGEEFFGVGTFETQPDSVCNADGTGTTHFKASGSATGPYPGTFTEEGTVTFGPRVAPNNFNSVTAFSSTFTISSAAGTVTGAKEFDHTDQFPFGTFDFINQGECRQVFGFGDNYFIVGVSYEATISPAAGGSCDDQGFGAAAGAQSRTIPPSNFFHELYASSKAPDPDAVCGGPGLPTTKGDCKKGGWQTYGIFKNQGDCVSFVATNGKNEPGQNNPN